MVSALVQLGEGVSQDGEKKRRINPFLKMSTKKQK